MDNTTNVHIGNLPSAYDARKLSKRITESCKLTPVRAKVVPGRSTYAFVLFGTRQDAEKFITACNDRGFEIFGCLVKASWAKKSARYRRRAPPVTINGTNLCVGFLVQNKDGREKYSFYRLQKFAKECTVDVSFKERKMKIAWAGLECGEDSLTEDLLSVFELLAPEEVKLEANLSIFKELHVLKSQNKEELFVFNFHQAPRIYEYNSIFENLLYWEANNEDQWHRQTKFGCEFCKFPPGAVLGVFFQENDSQLKKIKAFFNKLEEKHRGAVSEVSDATKLPGFIPFDSLTELINKSFTSTVAFQLLSVISSEKHTIIPIEHQGNFVHHVISAAKKYQSDDLIIQTLSQMVKRFKESCDPVAQFSRIITELQSGRSNKEILMEKQRNKNKFVIIRQVIFTPCRVYYLEPTYELSCRVLRQFSELNNNFLRVSFSDENMEKMGGLHKNTQAKLLEFVNKTLKDGIIIGNLHFKFLIFSASQLRDHDCWFFAPTENHTQLDIRSKLGDFSAIRTAAKYAARMGQCFSTTTQTVEVDKSCIVFEKDIKTPDGKYIFTDGIGQISSALAEEVNKGFLDIALVPSAFQIRFGGCKGVVALNPKLEGKKIIIRESMNKFPTEKYIIEVCSFSKPIPAHLNQQIIMLLSGLGIPNEVFMKKLQKFLDELTLMCDHKTSAINMLKIYGNRHFEIAELIESGIPITEPFMNEYLSVIKELALKELKAKSRLPIQKGRVLMGVIDEFGILEYGQVFVQYTQANANGEYFSTTSVVKGPVVVAKNPCLHPGDCRKFSAVDIPELHHLRDCVVFPSKGDRPHPSECSGSDLDGDLYHVFWDEEFIFPKNYDPSAYLSREAEQVKEVTEDLLIEFYTNNMKNDQLGVISNAHLVHADQNTVKCKECIQLAECCSVAVDFPKTGVPAVVPAALYPREYPDFMEKKDKIEYISKSVIGDMYRLIRAQSDSLRNYSDGSDETYDIEEEYEKSYNPPKKERTIVPLTISTLAFGNSNNFLEIAKSDKDNYDLQLGYFLDHYYLCEGEMVSGCFLSENRYIKKRKRKNQLGEILNAKFQELKRSTIEIFWQEFEPKIKSISASEISTSTIPTRILVSKLTYIEILSKASAYYQVNNECHLEENSLVSFPWISVGKLLIEILKKKDKIENLEESVEISHLLPSFIRKKISKS